VVAREVGTGFAIAITVLVLAVIAVWLLRRHRRTPALAVDRERGATDEPAP